MNATEIQVNPGANTLLTALSGANDGDVVILADGNYTVDNYIVLGKSIELKAAEGAKPVVEVNTYIKVQDNAAVKISGIKFDGANQGSYSHFIRVYTAQSLELEGCEICNSGASVALEIKEGDSQCGSLKINNCYFHDGANSAIYIGQGSAAHICPNVEITNSTFANYSTPENALVAVYSQGGALAADPADDAVLKVDHCTFYNFTKANENTYGMIDSRKSTAVEVSNCIFADPAEVPEGQFKGKATQMYGGQVLKCIRWNVPAHRNTPAEGNDINEDPLFTDAENGNYTLDAASPAINAGTDGKTLGDPRWYPSTTTAISNNTVSAKAVKFIENGQLIIMKNGVKYDLTGAIVK